MTNTTNRHTDKRGIMSSYKRKILIDLDGVRNEYEGGFEEQNLAKIKDGAKEFLEELSHFAELYLFTTRNLLLSVQWLTKNNIDKYFKDVTNIKIPSYLYIDDRCICFEGNYSNTLEEIKKFKAYWKK